MPRGWAHLLGSGVGDKPGSQVVLETKTAPKKGSTGQRGPEAMPASLPVRRPFGASGQVKALWRSAEATRYSKGFCSETLSLPTSSSSFDSCGGTGGGGGGRSGGARGSPWGGLGGIEGRQPKDVESFPKKISKRPGQSPLHASSPTLP